MKIISFGILVSLQLVTPQYMKICYLKCRLSVSLYIFIYLCMYYVL
jgi:hypothetical protein